MRYLCISVSFLDSLFHGKGDDRPEWPPSPMRLFQALIAGARTGCRESDWSIEKVNAFRWLESRPPPIIMVPKAHPASPHVFFVPDNVSDKVFDRAGRLISKVSRPHQLRDENTMHYLWPMHDVDMAIGERHAEILCREARNLMALGWGIDQAAGNGRILTEVDVATLSGLQWRPWVVHRPGEQTWRVPTKGSLDDLERVHKSFMERVYTKQYLDPVRCFSSVCYVPRNTISPRSFAVFELPAGIAFRQEDTAKVGVMLRSLAIRGAKGDTHEFPGGSESYVAGHAGQQRQTPPRFSYLPLPTIAHQYADGMIRRLLIAEPYSGDGSHARWAQGRLLSATLRDEKGNDRGALHNLWRRESKSMARRYVDEALAWCSVTPVILPGHDDGKHAKAEKLFLGALRQADIPVEAIADITLRKAPFWPGSQHPREYFLPDYLRGLSGWHVRLVFHDPVPGPLAIGAGRHLGLGLLAQVEE